MIPPPFPLSLSFSLTEVRADGGEWNDQEMEIGEVEELLQRRGIRKDPALADKALAMQKEREAMEVEMRAAREAKDKERESVVTVT